MYLGVSRVCVFTTKVNRCYMWCTQKISCLLKLHPVSSVTLSSMAHIEQETQSMDTENSCPFQASGSGLCGRVQQAAAAPCDDRYYMSHGNRGIAIIINNNDFRRLRRIVSERVGSAGDVAALEKCFQCLGFSKVIIQNDLTCTQIRTLLADVARMDHRHHDMLACAVLTHGEEGKIFGVDNSMPVEDLLAPFKDPSCSLMGKPKLFIIQATDQAQGLIVTDAFGDHEPPMGITPTKYSYLIPTEADFLIAYAPAYGIYSRTKGTRFIRHLAAELEQIGNREIMQVMTRVSRFVTEENQAAAAGQSSLQISPGMVPCITTMLTKDLYFD